MLNKEKRIISPKTAEDWGNSFHRKVLILPNERIKKYETVFLKKEYCRISEI